MVNVRCILFIITTSQPEQICPVKDGVEQGLKAFSFQKIPLNQWSILKCKVVNFSFCIRVEWVTVRQIGRFNMELRRLSILSSKRKMAIFRLVPE